MEEFKVQTSAFAPEFGRMPGGQISVVTRSGTNNRRGSASWYFRNDKLDASDWFANRDGLAKPKLRQNDVGAVLGGPIARDKTFLFFSHETLRLRLPQVAVLPVPSLNTRAAAPAALRPYLDAQPLPNGPELSGGFATFSAGFSDASSLDATSIRLDHQWNDRWSLFGRYNHAPSDSLQRAEGLTTASSVTKTVELNEDTLLRNHGWNLVGPYQGGWQTVVIRGAAGYDGMCRPRQYQVFVFLRGVFVGTLSPKAMDSRTDASLGRVSLQSEHRLSAEYDRYAAGDPLCCPSRTTRVEFEIVHDAPLLRPLSASTSSKQ